MKRLFSLILCLVSISAFGQYGPLQIGQQGPLIMPWYFWQLANEMQASSNNATFAQNLALATTNNVVATNGATPGQFYEFGSGWVGISTGTGISTNFSGPVSLQFPLNVFVGTNSYFSNSVLNGAVSGNAFGLTNLGIFLVTTNAGPSYNTTNAGYLTFVVNTNGQAGGGGGSGFATNYDGPLFLGAANDKTNIYGGLKTVLGQLVEEGNSSRATNQYDHAEGYNNVAGGGDSHAEGGNGYATGQYSHSEGNGSHALAVATHAEGFNSFATNAYAHTEGNANLAGGQSSHAEGHSTSAYGFASHSEGQYTIASNIDAHAEGDSTFALGFASHSEGSSTYASGDYSFAGGDYVSATNNNSFIWGDDSSGLHGSLVPYSATFWVSNGFWVNGIRLDTAASASSSQPNPGIYSVNTNIIFASGFTQTPTANGTYTNAGTGTWTNMTSGTILWVITEGGCGPIGCSSTLASNAVGQFYYITPGTTNSMFYGATWRGGQGSFYDGQSSGYSYSPQYYNYSNVVVSSGVYSNVLITNSSFSGTAVLSSPLVVTNSTGNTATISIGGTASGGTMRTITSNPGGINFEGLQASSGAVTATSYSAIGGSFIGDGSLLTGLNPGAITGGVLTNWTGNAAVNGYDQPSNYASIRQTFANAQASNSTVSLVFIGDSHICGFGAAGGQNGVSGYTNAATFNMLHSLANILGGEDDSHIGLNILGNAGQFTNYDTRCISNTWTLNGPGSYPGGAWSSATSLADYVYVPDCPVNDLAVWFYYNSANGIFDVVVDGVTNKQINTAALNIGVYGTNISIPTGYHTIDVKWDSGGYVAFFGLACLNTNKPVNIINAGWDASTAANWAGTPLNLTNYLKFLPNPIFISDLGNNDYLNGQTIIQCSNNLTTIIGSVANAGIPTMQLTSFAMAGVPLEANGWASMQRNAAHSQSLTQASGNLVYSAYADLNQIWGGSPAGANLGLMYNSTHPDFQGYYLGAWYLAQIFQPFITGSALNPAIVTNGPMGVSISNNAPYSLYVTGNTNAPVQLNVQNFNGGTNASGDVVVTMDDGNNNQYYVDLGGNSHGFTIGAPPAGTHTAYLWAVGTNSNASTDPNPVNMVIGTAGTNTSLYLSAGNGATRTNVVVSDNNFSVTESNSTPLVYSNGALTIGGNAVLTNVAAATGLTNNNATAVTFSNSLTLSTGFSINPTNTGTLTIQPNGLTTVSNLNVRGFGGITASNNITVNNGSSTAASGVMLNNDTGANIFMSSYGSAYGFGVSGQQAFGANNNLYIICDSGSASGGTHYVAVSPGGYQTNNVTAFFGPTQTTFTKVVPVVFQNTISANTNTASWYTPQTSTTHTITNSVNNGKAMAVISVAVTMSLSGVPGIIVQCPGIETNSYYFASGIAGTYTNTIRVPIQPGYTNTWVDAPTGSGASDTPNLITIEQ